MELCGHAKVLDKMSKDGVFKRGQEAEVLVKHRCTCRVNFSPFCDCIPKVQAKVKDIGGDEPCIVIIKHELHDGRMITIEKDGIKSVHAHYAP